MNILAFGENRISRHKERALFLALLCIAIIVSIFVTTTTAPTKTKTKTVLTAATLSEVYTPATSAFGLTYVRGIVYSAFYDEENLVGSPPGPGAVADIDYLLNYGVSELVKLPGDSRDHYYYLGSVFIPGSGTVEQWETPNGYRFAFLHMNSLWVSAPPPTTMPVNLPKLLHLKTPPTCKTQFCNNDLGDENTAKAVAYLLAHAPPAAPQAGFYNGGRIVGYSGWPTDPAYGNGTSGPANAHLCFLTTEGAVEYFAYIAQRGPIPPKPTFSAKLWNQYRVKHHQKLISAYSGKKLNYAASIWVKHEALCKGVVSDQHWVPQGKKGLDGYIYERFQGCQIYYWPHHSNWKPKVTKQKFLA